MPKYPWHPHQSSEVYVGATELHVQFLGHILSAQGTTPLKEKVQVIQNFPSLLHCTRSVSFWDLSIFTTVSSQIAPTSSNHSMPFSPHRQVSQTSWFELKPSPQFLWQSKKPWLTPPSPCTQLDALTSLMVDAFDAGARAVLQQHIDGE